MDLVVKVETSRATLGLSQFRLGLQDRLPLMQTIGAGQLLSIYKTFDEQGPGWLPLNYSSKGWMGKKYSAGHMLLQDTGHGKSSIHAEADANSVTLGTNVFYMALQQKGWSGTQQVGAYDYVRRDSSRDAFQKQAITNKLGRRQTVNRKLVSGIVAVHVRAFSRTISIPPRPFLVFRPEDPERWGTEVRAFVVERARQAGLEAS